MVEMQKINFCKILKSAFSFNYKALMPSTINNIQRHVSDNIHNNADISSGCNLTAKSQN